jgi:nucleotide-binding universal stress UspA family protein
MRTPDDPQTRGFSRILHATDFGAVGEIAFDHALRLAIAARGHLYLVHADRPDPEAEADWSAFPGIRSTLTRWGLLPVDAAATDVGDKLGVRVAKAQVGAADAAAGVGKFAEEHDCDLFVLATHAREGLARLLQGSVAETLARRADVPTLFLPLHARGFVNPATGTPRLRRILLPVDRSAMPAGAASLALRMADGLGCDDAELHALHVGSPDGAPIVSLAPAHDGRLRKVARRGSVVDVIIKEAATLDADLIVMPTAGHDGLVDRLMGSKTEQVLRRAGRPLLAVPLHW